MKIAALNKDGKSVLGVHIESGIIDIEQALKAVPASHDVPVDVEQFIHGGPTARAALREYVDQLLSEQDIAQQADFMVDESEVSFGPCVANPQKIICVGLNYRQHAIETGSAIPTVPILFNKFANALAAHREEVVLPDVSNKIDYEAELAIVIGREAKNVSKQEALNYVLGYCNSNDLSARDLQMKTPQWMLGKTCDQFCPIGPYLVTTDEIPNPNGLKIRSIVNGEVRQDSNTADMIFYCDEIISYISQHMTLMPGDIILTGTPEGVVMGYPPEKQVYLQDGDVVTIEIEHLGKLTNRMVKK
ncbi:fumarylacetoacetate hydrolase family protein [Ferviditalea candida]|uniref:Fumarylacetoacetate hydrolase family protein n=1 Tax=Ferviditalea candida TaxID=3108399 RepID=A0ABU5ZQH8_9BACL|nr:fumarylacetoacetate hydrolase family protein [Paenibacillaceae bacterium T2]